MTDLDFIKTPTSWPHWPWLPVVKSDMPAIVRINDKGFYQIARQKNMFEHNLTELDFEDITPEQIIEEGWRVD